MAWTFSADCGATPFQKQQLDGARPTCRRRICRENALWVGDLGPSLITSIQDWIIGSIQVSGDVPTLPWVRSGVCVRAGLGLAKREGVDIPPESWRFELLVRPSAAVQLVHTCTLVGHVSGVRSAWESHRDLRGNRRKHKWEIQYTTVHWRHHNQTYENMRWSLYQNTQIAMWKSHKCNLCWLLDQKLKLKFEILLISWVPNQTLKDWAYSTSSGKGINQTPHHSTAPGCTILIQWVPGWMMETAVIQDNCKLCSVLPGHK